jgi:DnaJ-domain-containing protein 1
VGKIAVALTAEIGGVLGDGVYRVFGPDDGRDASAGSYERSPREERARRYAAEALREQREAGQRAEEAYRRARATSGAYEPAGAGGAWSGRDRQRTDRYGGKTVVDYYEVLEVSPKARQSVIEKAYRALMREDHPDQGGDVARAQLINEAYQVLRDPEARARYDRQNGFA